MTTALRFLLNSVVRWDAARTIEKSSSKLRVSLITRISRLDGKAEPASGARKHLPERRGRSWPLIGRALKRMSGIMTTARKNAAKLP